MYNLISAGKNIGENILRGAICMIMDRIALVLAIVGGINWGSVGLFKFDIVGFIFGGTDSLVSRIIFTLVGLAGLWTISVLFKKIVPADSVVTENHE